MYLVRTHHHTLLGTGEKKLDRRVLEVFHANVTMRLTNKGHKVVGGRFRVSFFLILCASWLIWSFSHSVHIHVTLIQDEAVNNNLPPPNAQSRDPELSATKDEIKERMQLERLHQVQRDEGMAVVGQFRSKALLAQRQEVKHALRHEFKSRLRDASRVGLRDEAKFGFLNDVKHGANHMEVGRYNRKPYRPTIPAYKRQYPRVLFFVHIHKSAGTLFCRLAYRNRININREKNCNVQDDQYCCGQKDTLQAQITYANKTFWDLVAIERELYDSMAPDYYDYIVTLRDSKSRYYSHWSHLRRMMPVGPGVQTGGFGDSAWIFGNNTILDDRMRKRYVPSGVDPLGSFVVWSQGQPDNWNTRIICGAKCRPQPKFQITRELFEYTLQRANKFAHFLFVEDLEASYNQIARAYKWHKYHEIISTSLLEDQSKRRRDKEGVDIRLAKEKWDPFMSALDDALYEFAKRKYHNVNQEELWKPFQNQDIVDRYFAEGPKVGCLNGCCFNCSAY